MAQSKLMQLALLGQILPPCSQPGRGSAQDMRAGCLAFWVLEGLRQRQDVPGACSETLLVRHRTRVCDLRR